MTLAVGDIVDWVPGEKYDEDLPDGPMVVIKAWLYGRDNEELVQVLTYRDSRPVMLVHASTEHFGFYAYRFKKNVFLTAARKAIAHEAR